MIQLAFSIICISIVCKLTLSLVKEKQFSDYTDGDGIPDHLDDDDDGDGIADDQDDDGRNFPY